MFACLYCSPSSGSVSAQRRAAAAGVNVFASTLDQWIVALSLSFLFCCWIAPGVLIELSPLPVCLACRRVPGRRRVLPNCERACCCGSDSCRGPTASASASASL